MLLDPKQPPLWPLGPPFPPAARSPTGVFALPWDIAVTSCHRGPRGRRTPPRRALPLATCTYASSEWVPPRGSARGPPGRRCWLTAGAGGSSGQGQGVHPSLSAPVRAPSDQPRSQKDTQCSQSSGYGQPAHGRALLPAPRGRYGAPSFLLDLWSPLEQHINHAHGVLPELQKVPTCLSKPALGACPTYYLAGVFL